MSHTINFPIITSGGDLKLDIEVSEKTYESLMGILRAHKAFCEEEGNHYWYECVPPLDGDIVPELKEAEEEIRKSVIAGIAAAIREHRLDYKDRLQEYGVDTEKPNALRDFIRHHVWFDYDYWPDELLCMIDMEGKKIVKIVIKNQPGFGIFDEMVTEKLVLTENSIRFERIPNRESETNLRVKWRYSAGSEAFREAYEEVTKWMPEVLKEEEPEVDDGDLMEFIITYEDRTKERVSFWGYPESVPEVLALIRELVPRVEEMPRMLILGRRGE